MTIDPSAGFRLSLASIRVIAALGLLGIPFTARAGDPVEDLFHAASESVGKSGTEPSGVFALRINEQPAGDVIASLRGSDVLVPVADLEAAGLRGFTGTRERIGGRVYVSLL